MTATLTDTAARQARPARPPLHRLAWVTWRQHRTVLLVLTGAIAACALILFYYGRQMHTDFTSFDLSSCLPGHSPKDCTFATQEFHSDQNRVSQLMAAFLPLPIIFGLFIGAPLLAREYESGTYRFAFTQGAGRTRWMVTKISLLTVFTIVATTAFTLVVMWWYAPLVPLYGRLGNTGIQEIYGLVFVGRAVFALALGILAGALFRRVVPAIGATLVVWVAVVIPSITAVRPHLMSPLTLVNGSDPNGWVITDVWKSPTGSVLSYDQVNTLEYTAAQAGHKLDLTSYLAQKGYTHTVTYQPAGRFWDFQAIEAGGLVVVSIILFIAAVWLVRRRAA